MSAYLRPTAPIAPDVVLPADPGLAMSLAQRLMVKPLMANHHHGLWGYSGTTADGHEVTVQASGIGGPSAAAVVGELAAHGARRVIRIGTCGALGQGLSPGESLVPATALGADGTSAALGAELTRPDAELSERLAGAGKDAAIVSFDLGAGAERRMREAWIAAGLDAVDRETAAVFALAERLGIAAAAALVVDGTATGKAAGDDIIQAALLDLGAVVGDALRRVSVG